MARAVAAVEADPATWEARFRALLRGFRFLPGGRILAGAGRAGAGALNNCFVMGPVGDDVEAMLRALREVMLTLVSGGGAGCDFSAASPAGASPDAPGPVALMGLWDRACETFLGHPSRPGAMMATLRCDHPDIEAFVTAKAAPGQLSGFNLSVQITDAFMAAARTGRELPLVHGGRVTGVMKARRLWRLIARSAYDGGEPGVLFVDRINRENNLAWREAITATNPCGEIPLPPYGACDLGSLNLLAFVRAPFEREARLDLPALAQAAATAVRFLDDVIELTLYPLPAQAEVARATRRIGLGITGLADALTMLGVSYGQDASFRIAAQAMATIRDAAYGASAALAGEKGPFPAFDRDRILAAPFVARLPPSLRDAIAAHGLRNSHLLAIAPTGSISLLAGGVSTGIEPAFAAVQTRRIRAGSQAQEVELIDPAVAAWRARTGRTSLPPGFVTAHEAPIAAHVEMQAVLQPLVDNGISKTINAPEACSFESFRRAFDLAYDKGLKGCTVFRSTSARPGLLGGQPCRAGGAACE